MLGLIPATTLTVHAGHRCENCDEWIDGSPYCEQCYECAECCELCLECGVCSDCSGWEICDECGDNGNICVDCALDKGYHCPDCYECYMKNSLWCDQCGRCSSCVDYCDECSVSLGKGGLCVECAMDEGSHCPDCEACYGEVVWCQECGLCENCSDYCVPCTSEYGMSICEACAIDAGLHCPDCQQCYDESNWEYCSECGICANCVEYCDAYDLCVDCAVQNGYHCPSCEGCCEDEPICESCGEACRECADDFCESCGLCSDCVQVCPGCGACSNCAEICPNCEEYCSDCEDMCDDCEFCLVCCADIAALEGCDCSEWVCVESGDWQEHVDEEHIDTPQDGHTARPSLSWSWDDNWHWQACTYCDSSDHYSNRFAHTYDKRGMCTVCCYAQNSNIQILQQPVDVKHVNVQSPYEEHDDSNIAHFSVKAVGKSELTYTWYRRYYTGPGQWDYTPLTDPSRGEVFDGPDLYVLASTDSCYNTEYFMCIIVDEEGNQARTVEVTLQARHHYQYFKCWKGDSPSDPYETAGRAPNYHNLQCVGEGCTKTVNIRPHEDEDENDECDICRRAMPEILITEQPKSVKNVLATSSDEAPLDSNYATFSVKAVGKSDLTYTWCRKYYTAPGQWYYQPLTHPLEGEIYDAPTARILAPEDACISTYYYCCIITDEEGNEAQTIEVSLNGKHNYQYYKYYHSQTDPLPYAKQKEVGHVAVCVGSGCGKVSRLSHHIDVDKDFQCDICYYIQPIDELRLDFTAPVVGNKPDYNMTVDISACTIRGNGIDRTYRRWYESDNGVDGWRLMSPTDTFTAGKYYNVEVDVATISGREFSTYNTPATTYTVWLWTHDRRGQLKQTGNLAQKNYATLTLDPEYVYYCQPTPIRDIVIDGLDSPIAGQKPDYEVTLGGIGYKPDTGATLYRKNGITWKQYGEIDAMHVDSTYIAGKNYTCYITLEAEENYVFDSNITASINGQSAVWELYNDNKTAVISYEYTQIPPARIKEIHLTEVTMPWEGVESDWNVNLNSDLFYVDEMGWGDLTLDAGHYGEFELDHRYQVGFYLITNLVDGMFQCEFDENVTATVNGYPATILSVDYDGWNGSTVYIQYLCPPTKEKVKLTAQPKSTEVDKGKNATVTLSAVGTDLTYTWYYKNKGDSSFSKTTSFTGPSYTVEMNESRDGRQVYCVVTDGAGNTVQTDTVTLSMAKTKLAITTQPSNAYGTEGSTVKITVAAKGDGLTYQWYVKNAGQSTYSKSSVTSATYSATVSDKSHNRYLYCIVKDQYGNEVKTKTVLMRRKATITTQPKNTYVKEGATAKLTVKAMGDGLTYQWYVKNAGQSTYSKSSVTSATYSTTMSDKAHGRYVYCIVTDKYGKTAKTTTVLMRRTATIITQPKTTYAKQDATAKLAVGAKGDGLTYTWYIKNAGQTKYSKSSVTSATYSVTMSDKVHGRSVYCVVTDKYGNSEKSAVVVLRRQASITAQPKSVSAAKNTTAKVSFTAVGDGLTYKWYYKDKGASKFALTTTFKSNSYSVSMTAARAGRQVYCIVTDKYGKTAQTNTVTLSMK